MDEKKRIHFPLRIPRRAVLASFLLPLVKSAPETAQQRHEREIRRISHIPPEYLADLRARTSGSGETVFGDELEVGRFLVAENDRGQEVSAAILELYSEGERSIAPDLTEVQVYWLLRNSSNGRRLSGTEREAIVILSNWWPETFDPYYRDGDGTRRTLVERMREYPTLRSAFEKVGRSDIDIAEARSPD